MIKPTSEHSHLWNALPIEERKRLMPYMIQSHILQVWQCKYEAILAHKRYMRELNQKLKNLNESLRDSTKNQQQI